MIKYNILHVIVSGRVNDDPHRIYGRSIKHNDLTLTIYQ